jgi:hypothetical protein
MQHNHPIRQGGSFFEIVRYQQDWYANRAPQSR